MKFQQANFTHYLIETVVSIVDDRKAATGKAAKMIGNSDQWVAKYKFTESDEFLQRGVWRCYTSVRAQAKEGATLGVAQTIGLYDAKNKNEVLVTSKTID